MSMEKSEDVKKALAILKGEKAAPKEVLDLVKLLKAENAFGYATLRYGLHSP